MSRTQGNNPIRVKKQNETLIKEIIYKYGPISRTQIAEMLSGVQCILCRCNSGVYRI